MSPLTVVSYCIGTLATVKSCYIYCRCLEHCCQMAVIAVAVPVFISGVVAGIYYEKSKIKDFLDKVAEQLKESKFCIKKYCGGK